MSWVWGGASAVLVSAVGFTWIVSAVGERADVLVLARDVPAGKVLTAQDLRTVQVAADSGVIPVERRGEALGRQARVPLVAGSLLSPGMVGHSADFPPKGSSQVTLALEAAAAPSNLARGDRVAILPGPEDEAPVGDKDEEVAEELPSAVVGTVAGTRAPKAVGGVREVRVLVATAAVRRATQIAHPRLVVLPASSREAP
ncbi:SAF domain-containing protein [Streptomyces sp. NPDC007083]|uniref:SAF domain-containing protein n=1 Tax=unclassified Streptomyces TaxID=2593676 RepID=UPI003406EF75